ncbi:MAG: PAS domain S-box protein [Syntrophorhabdaceae bacterium]|nr:PAS domain S-box protein [Syntrophorhabdaceae bacterium]
MKDPSGTPDVSPTKREGWEAKRKYDSGGPVTVDLYRSFFDFAPNAMAMTDPGTGRILDVNHAFVDWSRYTRNELLGRTTVELGLWVPAEARDIILKELYDTGFVDDIEMDFRRRDGEIRRILFSAKLGHTENRKFLLSISRDITDRIRMERVLRQSEQRLSDIIEFLPDATFVIDREGGVIAWNRAIEEMTGVRKEDMIGKSNHVYAIPFYGRRRKLLIDLVGNSDESSESKYIYVKKNGDTIFAEAFTGALYGGKGACLWGTATPLLDDRGNQVGAIESIRDITDHAVAEEKLRSSYDEMRRLSAHIEEVRENERAAIARELHDVLGQILAVINMDLRWLNKKMPAHEKELHGKVASALALVKQATGTVQRVSSGLRPVVLDDFGLAAAVDHAVTQFRDQTGMKTNLRIDQTIDLDKNTSIALYRILQEALTNVIRHADATTLEVSLLRRTEDAAQLTVRDNGRGISDEQMRNNRSLGILGMRERASFIGGRLEISGANGRGTRITVNLPLKEAEHEK